MNMIDAISCLVIIALSEIVTYFVMRMQEGEQKEEVDPEKEKERKMVFNAIKSINRFVILCTIVLVPFCFIRPRIAIGVGFLLGVIMYFVVPIELIRINLEKLQKEKDVRIQAHLIVIVSWLAMMLLTICTVGLSMKTYFFVAIYGYCLPCTILSKVIKKVKGT